MELVAVIAIIAILVTSSLPHMNWLTKATRRVASENEAVEVANAVRRYVHDKMDTGELSPTSTKPMRDLINLELEKPDNVLRDYISGGMEGARIESFFIDLKTGILGQLTYVNQFDRVRISYDNEGRQTVEHVGPGI